MADLDEVERAAVQRRTLRVLILGQLVGAAALASSITVGSFVIQDMLGNDTPWAGVSVAAVTTGTAFMTQRLARVMRRRGRRPGLQYGYGLAVVGGLVAAIGVERGWLPVFLVGLFVFGNGQAANLIARYAAADLALPEERGRAMSKVVFAQTFGAVLGPALIGPAELAGQEWFGLSRYTGPWLFSGLFFAASFINISLQLRPDPLVIAGGTSPTARHEPRMTLVEAIAAIGRYRLARLALMAMVISQVTMVAVMAMTSVHMKMHGNESISQFVVSAHIAGMFAFSPLVGRYSDRKGSVPAIAVGSVVLIAGNLMAALSGDLMWILFPALWAIGLGWTFGFIGGSALLIDSVSAEERVPVQGAADLLMSLCGGVAGFTSGFINNAVGFHMLANFATVAAGVLLVTAFAAKRRVQSAAAAVTTS